MSPAAKVPLEFEKTGDAVLDRILGQGIPKQSTLLIAGEPGSGKTVLALQMLFHAARRGQKSLYFTTLSEPSLKVIKFMQQFEFFDVELLNKYVIFADLAAVIRQGPQRTLEELEARVEKHEPAFVVIDSFRAIGELLRVKDEVRSFVYDLAVKMAGWGATTLLVGEYVAAEVSTFAEFAVADGILRLGSQRQELTSIREFEVLKMRGARYVSGRHFFDISQAGIAFYPRVSAPEGAFQDPGRDTSERAPFGVPGLDSLVGGGVPRWSTTVLHGGTGTGKTLLSLQFLMEGARRGEKTVLFSLEEGPEQLRSTAQSVGWDLKALEDAGLLAIKHSSPVELSTDRYLFEAREEVRRMGASRVVFDSLTTMALGVPSERRFKELVYSIAKHMRLAGATVLMTVESQQLLGSTVLSGQGISFIADNVIQLRYVESGARLERAISVLKARGIEHDSEVRAMTIDSHGIQVIGGRFADTRGVLTGRLERRGEAQ